MLRRVALVRTDVTEKLIYSFIRVARIGEVGATLAVTSNRRTLRKMQSPLLFTASVVPSSPILITLMKEALISFETSVLTRATRRYIADHAILHSHRRENLKSYIALTVFLRSVRRLLVTANVVPSSLIPFTQMMEALKFLRNVCSYKNHTA
jgi:hypothetical protein